MVPNMLTEYNVTVSLGLQDLIKRLVFFFLQMNSRNPDDKENKKDKTSNSNCILNFHTNTL